MAQITSSWTKLGEFTGTYTSRLYVTERLYARLISQDIASNTSVVQFRWTIQRSLSGVYDNTSRAHSVNFGSGSWSVYYKIPSSTSTSEETAATSGNYTISHSSDGSYSATWSWSGNGYDGVTHTGSTSVTLATIPRASKPSVSNYTVNDTSGSMSFGVESKADFYQVVTASLAGTTVYSGSLHVNATTATVTVANSKLLAALPSATSGTLTVAVKTYQESSHTTQVGDTQTASATVTVGAQIVPSVSSAGLEISSTPLTGILVAGYSTLKVSWTATAGASASVSKVAWSVSGTSFSGTGTSASGSATTGTVPSLSYDYAVKATVTVTDSRGRTASATSAGLTVKGYTPPSLSVTFFRTASDTSTSEDLSGAYTYASFSAAVSSLSDSGNAIASLTGTYSGSLTGSATTGEHKSLAIDKTATLTVTAKDTVGGTVSRTITVGVSAIPLDLYDDSAGNVGVGLGGPAVPGSVSAYIPLYVEGGRVSGTILTGSMDLIKWSKVGRLVTITGQANLSGSIEAWGVKTIATLPCTSETRVVAPVATQNTPMPLIVDISGGSTQLNICNWSGSTYSPGIVAFNFSYLAEDG